MKVTDRSGRCADGATQRPSTPPEPAAAAPTTTSRGAPCRRVGTHEMCAGLLGWAGAVLPRITVFDTPFVPVVALDWAAHRDRMARGFGPATNRDQLEKRARREIWGWGELVGRAPRPAVHLVGALFDHASLRWQVAFGQAASWRAFGPTAVYGTGPLEGIDADRRRKHHQRGVGLIILARTNMPALGTSRSAPLQGLLVEPAAAGRRPGTERRVADRWLEEILYELALATDCFNPASISIGPGVEMESAPRRMSPPRSSR